MLAGRSRLRVDLRLACLVARAQLPEPVRARSAARRCRCASSCSVAPASPIAAIVGRRFNRASLALRLAAMSVAARRT